jgi:hypothetical protein
MGAKTHYKVRQKPGGKKEKKTEVLGKDTDTEPADPKANWAWLHTLE